MSASSRLFDRFYCGGLFRPSLRAVGYAVSAALVVTMAPAADASARRNVVWGATTTPAVQVSSRADAVSARVSARAQGSRVEVEDLRTETSTTWVNPDGTFTTEQHQGLIRFRNPSHKGVNSAPWVKVNLDVETKSDGTVGAVGHPGGLSLAGKTLGAGKSGKSSARTDAVAVNEKAGRSVSLAWPGGLPTPVLKGTSATYSEVLPGVDFVVHSRRTGFESDVVIKTIPARDALVSKAGESGVSFSFPVKTKGLTARAERDGSVSFVDAKGGVESSFAAPLAWDGQVDPVSGNRVSESPVKLTVSQKGVGQAVLTMTPDPDWLSSPERVAPITIDPTYATGSSITTSFDTFVSASWGNSTTPQTMTELRVGTYDGGGDVARSYLNFPVTGIQGADVVSAHLSLFEFHSYSCTAKPFYAYNSGAASTATTWGNQPTQYALAGTLTTAKGFSSSCAAGRVSVPITPVVQGWTSTGYQNGSLKLSASETDSYGWKKFYSLESSQDPYITYTYNRKPNAASAPTVTNGVTYTPPGGTLATYTKEIKPELNVIATDPDLNGYASTIEVHSSTTGSALLTTCSTPTSPVYTASGQKASCTIPTALSNNSQAYVRAAVKDERGLWNGTWSPWTTIRVGTTVPTPPVISCPAPYTNGYSTATVPSGPVSCTISAVGSSWSAPSQITVSRNGTLMGKYPITPSTDPAVAKATIQVPNTAGTHNLSAFASTPSNVASNPTSHVLFFGSPTMESPANRTSSTGIIPVKAVLPKPAGTLVGKFQWRVAGAVNDPWTTENSPLSLASTATEVVAIGTWNVGGVSGQGINGRVPVTLEGRVCLHTTSDTSTCIAATSPALITRVPNALGAGYPADSSTGAGTVALFTGEFSAGAADVSLGDLSVSRSYESFNGDGTTADSIRGVFGPGWTGDFGAASGLSALTVQDTTPVDGRISIGGSDGTEPMVFNHPSGNRGTYARTAGTATYLPSNDAAVDADLKVVLKDVSSDVTPQLVVLEIIEADGTATRWAPTTVLSETAQMTWGPLSVTSPSESTSSNIYFYPVVGDLTKIGRVVVVPEGKTSTQCPGSGAWTMTSASPSRGCTRLDITYGASSIAPQAVGQVATVTGTLWDPSPTVSAMTTVTLATYEYDSSKRLTKVTDGRTSLPTRYAWNGTTTQLSTITPPGLAPYRLWYAAGAGNQRITGVTRDSATAGTWNPAALTSPPAGSSILARYVTGVPLSASALPNLTAAGVGRWHQSAPPTTGFAVFGPGYAWDGTATSMAAPSSSSNDWQFGRLSYTTSDGYTVNTAAFGSGAWQLTSTDFDAEGREGRVLSPGAIASIVGSPEVEDRAQTDALSSQTLFDSDGNVTHEYGPIHEASMSFVAYQSMRSLTQYWYDQGAPNGGINPKTGHKYGLVTTSVVAGTIAAGSVLGAEQRTVTGYGAVETGDPDGWDTGQSTSVTQQSPLEPNAATDVTQTNRYDAKGRVIEVRQPLATSTASAGTRRISYYSTGAQSGTNAPCGGFPEWDGMVCREYSGAPPSSGPALTEMWHTYDKWGNTSSTVEKTGTGTTLRVTTATADVAGRPSTNSVTSTVAGSAAIPGQTFAYSSSTGLPTTLTSTGTSAVLRQDYDGWGRPTTYTNEQGDTSSTGYGADGRPAVTVEDPSRAGLATQTTTYTWDGQDAEGGLERRGLLTQMSITRDSVGGTLTYKGKYTADGQLATQTLPGKLAQRQTYDLVGNLTELAYTGQVTRVTETADPDSGERIWTEGAPLQNQTWLAWNRTHTILGQVAQEWNGAGAAFDGVPGVDDPADITAPSVGRALAAEKAYGYDHVGRLAWSKDRTAVVTGDVTTPDSPDDDNIPCTWRSYAFDKNGNRTGFKEGDHANCGWASLDASGASPTSNDTYAYDSADRPLTGANGVGTYVYDALGRQTTLPAVDAPNAGTGDITIGYFHNDLASSIKQGTNTTTFTLDPALRRASQSTSGAAAATILRHYTNTSDNPTWIATTSGGTTSVARISGTLTSLFTTFSDNGDATMSLPDPHGDVVTATRILSSQDASTAVSSIEGWGSFDEYGNTTGTDVSDGPIGYGYLGAYQRSTTPETAGLTLMGARLYVPSTGRFTSPDPAQGSSATTMGYPFDPVNTHDVSGEIPGWVWGAAMFGYEQALAKACSGAIPVAWYVCEGIAGYIAGVVKYIGEMKWVKHRSWNWTSAFRAGSRGMAESLALGKFLRSKTGKKVADKVARGLNRLANWASAKLRRMGYGFLAGLIFTISATLAAIFQPPRNRR